jgi:hypothetical protein
MEYFFIQYKQIDTNKTNFQARWDKVCFLRNLMNFRLNLNDVDLMDYAYELFEKSNEDIS